ncbi:MULTISPECIES: hypothetical protein [Clostridium]|uniref:hypothetical protein n=1 Tax=Clostridium TaxID=1485 RepID=UPI00069E580D|nr:MULTISPECIES: hypothetical protein [Clostridium]KOF55744.1 hypothetical protein AGR56_18140 [Clostridium sp. DMHC 10]MCD2345901.1 hypothetical protein [Clostridium guangxiense]
MGNLLGCICYSFLVIVFFIDYLKNKKMYTLLAAIFISIVLFFETPLASGISKIAKNTLTVIMLILMATTVYLIVKEYKEYKEKKK